MWTLTNQWDMDITTAMNTGTYRAPGPSVTFHFRPTPIWAQTSLSAICVADDDYDFAAIYFTEYSYIDERGHLQIVNVDKPSNKFKKKVRIGSESMTSLTFSTDSTHIGARGVVSIQFWEKS